jgi:hypothetical protein
MSIVVLLVSINLIILAANIIFKACIFHSEDSHVEQPIAGVQKRNGKSDFAACV